MQKNLRLDSINFKRVYNTYNKSGVYDFTRVQYLEDNDGKYSMRGI